MKELGPSLIDEALLSANHPARDKVLRLLRIAPEMSIETMSSPTFFTDSNFWEAGPRNWDTLQSMPRYFKGR